MKATERQVWFLNKLQERVLNQCRVLGVQPGFTPHDWNEDIDLGMTTDDASVKIKAFKSLVLHYNYLLLLSHKPQL